MHKICLLIIIIQIHIFISSYLNFLHFFQDWNFSQLSSKHDYWFFFALRINFKFSCLGFKDLKLPFQPISWWYFLSASAASFSSWAPWSSSFSLGLAHRETEQETGGWSALPAGSTGLTAFLYQRSHLSSNQSFPNLQTRSFFFLLHLHSGFFCYWCCCTLFPIFTTMFGSL